MNYRPLTDVWILARPKVKYYGAYPSGFLHRARELLGVTINDAVLHVCGGRAREYPFRGFGPNDKTQDARHGIGADFTCDARHTIPLWYDEKTTRTDFWPAIIADPPYTLQDAEQYGSENIFPEPRALLALCINAVRVGGRVGFLHYVWPRPPANARSVACIGVIVGFGNRMRCYSVFERTA